MTKLKVMIVDDEPIIRKGLIQFIDWSSTDYEVVYGATDGDDAWQHLPVIQPDIVITDIRMPGRSGLDLARALYEQFPKTQVILLTGYADFAYARQAIQFNVVDFVLKPTQKNLILAALEKAKARISQDRERIALEASVVRFDRERTHRRKEDCLRSLIHGGRCQDPDLAAELDRQLQAYHMVLVEAAVRNEAGDWSAAPFAEFGGESDGFELLPVIRQSFDPYENHILALRHGQYAILAVVPERRPDLRQVLADRCGEMAMLVEALLAVRLTVGLSGCHAGIGQVADAFSEAAAALAGTRVGDAKRTREQPGEEPPTSRESLRARILADEILRRVLNGEPDAAGQQLGLLFQIFREDRHTVESIRDACLNLASRCAAADPGHNGHGGNHADGGLNGHGGQPGSHQDMGDASKQVAGILMADSLRELHDILEPVVSAAAHRMQKRPVNSIILATRSYLHDHFSEHITLQQIADHVHVSPSYLSRLFHRETGQTIVDVCRTIRLDQACLLLRTTDLRNFEIAARVGIEDPAYFSKLFREHTGASPTEYRTRNRLDEGGEGSGG